MNCIKCKPVNESFCFIKDGNMIKGKYSHECDNDGKIINQKWVDADGNEVDPSVVEQANCPDCTKSKPTYMCNTGELADAIAEAQASGVQDVNIVSPDPINVTLVQPDGTAPTPVKTPDVEFVCNGDTDMYDQVTTTYNEDGTVADRTVVASEFSCADDLPPPEFFTTEQCRDNKLVEVVTMITADGTETEHSVYDLGKSCGLPCGDFQVLPMYGFEANDLGYVRRRSWTALTGAVTEDFTVSKAIADSLQKDIDGVPTPNVAPDEETITQYWDAMVAPVGTPDDDDYCIWDFDICLKWDVRFITGVSNNSYERIIVDGEEIYSEPSDDPKQRYFTLPKGKHRVAYCVYDGNGKWSGAYSKGVRAATVAVAPKDLRSVCKDVYICKPSREYQDNAGNMLNKDDWYVCNPCPDCTDLCEPSDCPTACVQVESWDKALTQNLIKDGHDAGQTNALHIFENGVETVITSDYFLYSDGVNKSSWYPDYLMALNSIDGLSVTLVTDVSVDDDGNAPIWRYEYNGCKALNLRIEQDANSSITLDFDGKGNVNKSYSWDDGSGSEESTPFTHPCGKL